MKHNIHMKYLTTDDVHRLHHLAEVVADRVDEALAVKGMTQKRLGERAGIKNPRYAGTWWGGMRRAIRAGRFNPSAGMVLRLARALRVEPHALLEPMR